MCVYGGLAQVSSNPEPATLKIPWKNDRSQARPPCSLAVLPVKTANLFGGLDFSKSAIADS
jgi:hypothetical protein